jgi:uncharacterized protein YkwD
MYQFEVFARSILLLVISAVFLNTAYALAAENTSVEKHSNPTIVGQLNLEGINPKAAIANNPPVSQMRDLNADGTLDFVTTHSKLGGVSIALGLGDGKFEQPMNYLSGKKPLTVRVRDFNNDNTPDLVAYNFKQKTVSVLFGDGNGSFTEQKTYRMNSALASKQSGQNNPLPTTMASTASVSPKAAAAPLTSITALEQSIHRKINAYRVSRRLPALALNATISNVARTHSQNMASGRVPFGHQGFDARVRTLSRTFTYRRVGENVAYNRGYSDPAAVAVNGWLKSQGHLNNIVGDFNLTGIGVARSSNGAYYFTQVFWRR